MMVGVCRWAVQAIPEADVMSSAILKAAAGTPLLTPSLSADALLTEVGPRCCECLLCACCYQQQEGFGLLPCKIELSELGVRLG